jgi:hypothetical protein
LTYSDPQKASPYLSIFCICSKICFPDLDSLAIEVSRRFRIVFIDAVVFGCVGARFHMFSFPILGVVLLPAIDGFQVLNRLQDRAEPLAASARVALVNALSRPFMTLQSLEQRGFAVATGQKGYFVKERVRGKVVTIMGFGGNVTKIATTASKVYVTELTPHLFQSRTISRDGVVSGPFFDHGRLSSSPRCHRSSPGWSPSSSFATLFTAASPSLEI